MSGKIVIGVTGDIGAGKTTFVKELEKFNIYPIYTDEITHKILKFKKVKDSLCSYFGNYILENDEIAPKKLAQKAFQNKKNWQKLIVSTHPYIIKEIHRIIETTDYRYYAIEAPLLFEASLDEFCDFIIYIKAPYQIRIKRLQERLSYQDVKKRSSFLIPLKNKKQRVDFIVNNNQNKRKVKENAQEIWSRIKRNRGKKSRSEKRHA